jgi:hypothetical protein
VTWKDFLLKMSSEGREWAKLILPVVLAWHCPQPPWISKK